MMARQSPRNSLLPLGAVSVIVGVLAVGMLGAYLWPRTPAQAKPPASVRAPAPPLSAAASPTPAKPVPVITQPAVPSAVDFSLIEAHAGSEAAYGQTVESEVLAVYDKIHAAGSPGAADGRIAVRIFAWLAAAGDRFGEGYGQLANQYARAAVEQGNTDPLVRHLPDNFMASYTHSRTTDELSNFISLADSAMESVYPPVVKFSVAVATARNLSAADREKLAGTGDIISSQLPLFIDMSSQQLLGIARTAPPPIVAQRYQELLDAVAGNMENLAQAQDGIRQVLDRANAPEASIAYLQVAYLIAQAGTIRENTPQDSSAFVDKLQDAAEVAAVAGQQFPADPRFPAALIAIDAGLKSSRPNMEQSFTAATRIDPAFLPAYHNKMSYLQPDWCGSAADVLAFARECLATEQWEAALPLVAIRGLETMQPREGNAFADPAQWNLLDQAFRAFLSRYPNSIFYRTCYLNDAYRARQWEVARAQLKLLGENWDRSVLTPLEYRAIQTRLR